MDVLHTLVTAVEVMALLLLLPVIIAEAVRALAFFIYLLKGKSNE